MKAVFSPLSGSRRGETLAFEKESLLVGTLPDADLRFDPATDGPVGERHAEVRFEECEYYLRDLGSGSGTFVNRHQVDEVILRNGDLIEFGEGGPQVRFRAEWASGEVCKPFRVVYRDALRKTQRFRKRGLTSTAAFAAELGRGLARDTSPRTRRLLAAGLVVAAASAVLSSAVLFQGASSRKRLEAEIVQLRRQLDTDRRSRMALERDVSAERRKTEEARARHVEDTGAQLGELREAERKLREQLREAQESASLRSEELKALKGQLDKTTRKIRSLDLERSLAERLIRKYQGGVALIEGAYRFEDAAGNPLRLVVADEKGTPVRDAKGGVAYTTTGNGPVVLARYTGTGFLVSAKGWILTNRHIAEPWWKEEETSELASRGLKPRLEHLRAYFPLVPEPFELSVAGVSGKADVALVKASLGGRRIPVLEVDREDGARAGQPVVLLGYPAGLDALLARLDDSVVSAVVADAGTDSARIARELSKRGMIRPLATQGHLSDVLPGQLVYDAQTTLGGSGGPVFDTKGKVIGLNFAILSEFSGASFGVPIRFGLELVPDEGL